MGDCTRPTAARGVWSLSREGPDYALMLVSDRGVAGLWGELVNLANRRNGQQAQQPLGGFVVERALEHGRHIVHP